MALEEKKAIPGGKMKRFMRIFGAESAFTLRIFYLK
jgi:hypothetical protein